MINPIFIILVMWSSVNAQDPGTNFICVPPGTCISNNTATTPIIDPRIVTPVSNDIPAITRPCPSGLVPCYGSVGSGNCGRRYVANVSTTDGASTNGAFPWQAFITNQTGYIGSGVLLDDTHVLTAAHKVYTNQETPGNLQVYMGVYNALNLSTAQQRTVIAMHIHPNFTSSTLRNDIAVLRLNPPISLGYQINVGTACLPVAGTSFVGQNCIVSGWGQTGFNITDSPTSPQKQVTVPIVNYTTCRTSMAQPNLLDANVDTFLDQNELCAGGQANKDACTQDGGAPLVCESEGRFMVAGLVIWGKKCGQPGVYGVYVDVAKYSPWINAMVQET